MKILLILFKIKTFIYKKQKKCCIKRKIICYNSFEEKAKIKRDFNKLIRMFCCFFSLNEF